MRLPDPNDIIVAIATPPGEGAIGVIRVSGPGSIALVNDIFIGKNLTDQRGYTLHFGKIQDGSEVLDEVLVSVFKAPKSYTGQDSLEISCHGSRYILNRCVEVLIGAGARLAEPGEFTFRGFLNKKLDLAQAEAVADLIASESLAQHKLAMNQMRGGFSDKLKMLREQLINLAALIELELDFGEEDVEFADRSQLRNLLLDLNKELTSLAGSFSSGNAIKQGIPVVLAGKPNAGKSTLLNALINEDRAIVSHHAGTTRDVIEEQFILHGLPVRFVDTAGLRHSTDEIEQMGMAKTMQYLEKAVVALYLFDPADTTPALLNEELQKLEDFETEILPVFTKSDRHEAAQVAALNEVLSSKGLTAMAISAINGSGIEDLKERLYQSLSENLNLRGSSVQVSNLRHYQALKMALQSTEEAQAALDGGLDNVLVAYHLRDTLRHVGAITGEVDVDNDILGAIFSRFCIGK